MWLVVPFVFFLGGCADTPPFRTSLANPPTYCNDVYQEYDNTKNSEDQRRQVKSGLKDKERHECWISAWERHAHYDLLSLEFDDQGWLADVARNPQTVENQLTTLVERLNALMGQSKTDQRPLSIIVYTHGWHHSAAPDDSNVVAFRDLLEGAARIEQTLCFAKRPPEVGLKTEACTETENVPLLQKARHVVGIYIGWRGDSILGPGIENLSIWDRKLAAEKVALGSVQEFYARIHDFYLKHTCHSLGSENVASCPDKADVRLLTIGHSFGGLITYRSLAPRLMLGVVETHRSSKGTDQTIPYAYGFGDLTVLINPAFEGTRYEPLAWAATHREYQQGEQDRIQKTAQLPYLIIAQSKGDVATRYAFPVFRSVTTLLETTHGQESEGNIKTVGWAARYKTHDLMIDPQHDVCGGPESETDLGKRLNLEAKWSEDQLNGRFRTFNGDLRLCNGLLLKKTNVDTSPDRLPQKAFMPLWVVQADASIIKDHNDFLNPRLVDFVWQIYYTILRADDDYMARIFKQK